MTRKLSHGRYEQLKALGVDFIEDYELAYPLDPVEVAGLLGVQVTVHDRELPPAAQSCSTTDGYNVIPNVRLTGRISIPYALAGVPSHSTLAPGLHGCTKSRANRSHVTEAIRIICDLCEPANLVAYGSDAYGVLNYPLALGIPVHIYSPDTFRRSVGRKAA